MINTKYSSPFFSSVKFFCIICILSYSIFSHAQNWNEVIKSVASDREAGDWFGYDVAMSGDYAIVGALYEDEDTNGTSYKSSAGSAYIFKLSAGVWVQQQKLVATDRRWGDRFGNSVAIDGDYAIVGATRTDYDASGLNFIGNGGAAYVFKRTAGVWSQQQKITASDRQGNDNFGHSVSISGEYAIIGANKEDHDAIGDSTLIDAGSAYIFQRTGTNWTQQQKIVAADRAEFDQFGESIAIEGNYAIVGAYQHNYDTSGGGLADNAGAVYVFQQSGGTWTQHQKLVASDRASGDRFGRSVAISGNYIIAGADYHDYDTSGGNAVVDAGAAYVFQQMAGVWTQQQKLVASDRGSRSELYGEAVAINGDYVIVTSKHEDKDINGANTRFGAGAAYIYERVGGTWIEDQKIVASDRETEDYFGFSVAINQAGDALVSAVFEDEDTSGADSLRSAGAVYFFEPACSKIAPANFLGPDISRCTGNQNISVNIPGATYTWSTGQTSDSISVSTSGTYSITVNHAATGCVLKDTIAIDFYTHPPSGLPASLTVCSDTGAILTSKPYAQTRWNTGDTTSAITANSSGIYFVTVTDNFGCSNTDSVNVTIYALPSSGLPASLTVCSDTGAILTSKPYSKTLWNTGDTTSAITVNSSGIYFVTVTDSLGCSNTDSVNVTIYALPSSGLPASLAVCSDTGVILTSDPYPKTLWNTGDTTSAITANSSGIYFVTVTDSFGCSNTDSVNLTIYTHPPSGLPASLTVCSDTGVILTSKPYSKTLWNTGDTTSAIKTNSSGIYFVTLTDSFGCSNTDSVNLTIYALPTVSAGRDSFRCGNNLTLTATGADNYTWSNGATTAATTVTSSGSYSVLGVGSNGCTNSDTVSVQLADLPVPNLGADTTSCLDPILLFAGIFQSYSWSTGGTGRYLLADSSGLYSIIVTNTNGCSATDSIQVSISSRPKINLGNDTVFCGDNLLLTLDPGNTYLWSNGSTTQSINANSSGSYSAVVTNANGCSATDTINVTLLNNASTPVLSRDGNTLHSTIGGTHQWFIDGNPITNESDSFLTIDEIGSYTAVSIDSNGCVSDTSNALAKTAGIGKLPSSSLKVYPNPTNHKVTIDASGLGKIQSIKLYDSQGKLVENTQTTNNSLVHLEWTATNGMLWVVVTTNKGTYRTKVVSIH